MPNIEWSVEQAEGVRQLLFDRIDWLVTTQSRAGQRREAAADMAYLQRSLDDMREIVSALESAYRPDASSQQGD